MRAPPPIRRSGDDRGAQVAYLRSRLQWARALVARKLGVCPFCMRASLLGTVAGWSAYTLVRFARAGRLLPALLLVAACCFTLLLLAHLVAYMVRVAIRLRSYDRLARTGLVDGAAPLGRRRFLALVLQAGAYALAVAFLRALPVSAQGSPCKGTHDVATSPPTPVESDIFGTEAAALADQAAKEKAKCDSFCAQRNCAPNANCLTSAAPTLGNLEWLHHEGGMYQCRREVKSCSCDCYACTSIGENSSGQPVPWPYGEATGDGGPGAEVPAMEDDALAKCEQLCAKITKCPQGQTCKAVGKTLGKHKPPYDIGGGLRRVSAKIRECQCRCR
jgi:hypothetical protein